MTFLQICGRSYKRSYKRPDTFLQRSYRLLDVPTKSGKGMGCKVLSATAAERTGPGHKRWRNAVRSYNARLDPEQLTFKNEQYYCPTICAIQKKKFLNHKRIGMPRPGSAKKKPPPLPAPPSAKLGPGCYGRSGVPYKRNLAYAADTKTTLH